MNRQGELKSRDGGKVARSDRTERKIINDSPPGGFKVKIVSEACEEKKVAAFVFFKTQGGKVKSCQKNRSSSKSKVKILWYQPKHL